MRERRKRTFACGIERSESVRILVSAGRVVVNGTVWNVEVSRTARRGQCRRTGERAAASGQATDGTGASVSSIFGAGRGRTFPLALLLRKPGDARIGSRRRDRY